MLAYGCLRTYTEGERSYGCCRDDTFASKEEAPQTMNPLRKVFKECQIFPPLSPPLKAALCTQRTMGHHCSAAPNQAMFWGMKCWGKKGGSGTRRVYAVDAFYQIFCVGVGKTGPHGVLWKSYDTRLLDKSAKWVWDYPAVLKSL